MTSCRQLAFWVLRRIDQKDTYADKALDHFLQKYPLAAQEKALATELVYGVVRRQRTLDALIQQFSRRALDRQPPDLRRLLQLGLYQLRYLEQIPAAAAVHTTVDLAKKNNLGGLSAVVNGILRAYLRAREQNSEPLILPAELTPQLGILYSFPDWIIELFLAQWGEQETRNLCAYFNTAPTIDLRLNPLRTDQQTLQTLFQQAGIATRALPNYPQALRLRKQGSIRQLPGWEAGLWTVQAAEAQGVSHWLAPQPGEDIIDACAAPGGKTTHIAELMGDRGHIWALEPTASRLEKLKQSQKRLGLKSIETWLGDARQFRPPHLVDRVLVDVPCSGLGTLHRNPDIRWRQTPQQIQGLLPLQQELLTQAATWVKPGGVLIYATCTLNAQENQQQLATFLAHHPTWQVSPPAPPQGWQLLPHHQQGDGFFVVKMKYLPS